MKPKKTKAQIREEQEKAALADRLHDIACGAFGTALTADYFDCHQDDLLELWGATNTEGMGRFMMACREVFELEDQEGGPKRYWMVGCHVLDEWATLPKLTDFLYRNGIRA